MMRISVLLLLLVGACCVAWGQPGTSAVLGITGTSNNTSGSITITVNGVSETVTYGPFSSAASIAAGFGAYFSAPPNTPVPPLCASGICAKSKGASIVFQFEDAIATPTESWSTTLNSPFQVDPSQWPASGSSAPVPMILECNPNPMTYGSTTSCTAGLPAGTSGSVHFAVDGNSWTSVAIDPNGNAVAAGALSGAAVGTHFIEAQYQPASGTASTAFENVQVEAGSTGATTVYSYSISASGQSGYAANGNIVGYTDSVNGQWTLKYDVFDRLISSSQMAAGGSATTFGCWSYDSFGNRTAQATSDQDMQGVCIPPSGASNFSATAMSFGDGTNRITARGTMNLAGATQTIAAPGYDNVGNVLQDQTYQYKYDGQGHMCAAHTAQGMIGYIYDAEGHRVAKGTITSMSCDPTANGFVATTIYELGPNGQPMTEVDGGSWSHTDVYAGGEQIATYDGNGVHFQIHDWLGTRRVQTNYAGVVEDMCSNNPYGDNQNCSNTAADVSDCHFTGKERDAESGLDYFGARYLNSNMGRWMSPDWSPTPATIPYGSLGNPQSLNLYRYVANNPLVGRDLDGHKFAGNYPGMMDSMHDARLYVLRLALESEMQDLEAEQVADAQKEKTAPPPPSDTDAVAIAAEKAAYAMKDSQSLEYGGVIYRDKKGKLGFTKPKHISEAGQPRVVTAINPSDRPNDTEVAGFYHSHAGLSPHSEEFSQTDLDAAYDYSFSHQRSIPSYMGTADGGVYRFTPDLSDSSPQTDQQGRDRRQLFTIVHPN